MKKKLFTLLFIVGALSIWSLLPLYNYSIDQWRVLHKDYHYAYERIMINKVFLKEAYLLDYENKYDTILMGSSRNGSFDVDRISGKTYNLESSFSTIGTHLHNLRILLNEGLEIKNLWISVNDYDTWKNANDFESDWARRPYKNTIIEKFEFYRFYLYKNIDKRDISIFEKKSKLVKSERIVEKINRNIMYEKEKYILDNAKFWKNKMTSTGAILLGYTDSKYRIDEAIKDIKEIRDLCKQNNIQLTILMYPSFYKTYISYNQRKIEEFKKKLVKVTPFYDFYMLNDIALNELNWFDSSHFTFSIGNYIIDNIKLDKHLITKDNIKQHLMQVRDSIHSLIDKVLPIKYIYPFHADIDLSSLTPIFKLIDNIDTYKVSQKLIYQKKSNKILLKNLDDHSSILLKVMNISTENVILDFRLTSKYATRFKISYKKTINSEYNTKNIFSRHVGIGTNHYHLSIPSEYINYGIKINFGEAYGTYTIDDFTIYQ